MSKMVNPSEPRPQCPECGSILHPRSGLVVVSDDDETEEDRIPDGLELHILTDVFSGLYCCGDCVLDAIKRGWPEYRNLDKL